MRLLRSLEHIMATPLLCFSTAFSTFAKSQVLNAIRLSSVGRTEHQRLTHQVCWALSTGDTKKVEEHQTSFAGALLGSLTRNLHIISHGWSFHGAHTHTHTQHTTTTLPTHTHTYRALKKLTNFNISQVLKGSKLHFDPSPLL